MSYKSINDASNNNFTVTQYNCIQIYKITQPSKVPLNEKNDRKLLM